MLLRPDPAGAEKRALQLGRRGEEPLRQLVTTLNDVFWIYEPHCARFFYVSPAYERDWARSADALYADLREWFAPVHADDRPLLEAAFDRLASGEGYAMEYRETTRSGSLRWISERAIRGVEVCGQPLRFAGVSHDITARKSAKHTLLRSNRRKDEFLSVLSHELRRPLQPLRTAAALLALQRRDVPEIEASVSVIQRQVEHMGRLIEDLAEGSEFVATLPSVCAPAARAAVAPLAAAPRRRKRVLLVDDNRDAAQSLQALLEMDGHTVAVAFTGQAALERAAQVRPQIVILDVNLSDISGYDIARRLREDTNLADSLLVAITGPERGRERHASLQAGFDHHFVKPASPVILLDLARMHVTSAAGAAVFTGRNAP